MHLPLSRDGWLLFAACGVRSLAFGSLSVILGLYLDTIGLSTTVIGWIFTAALAGGAVMTILITHTGRHFRQKTAANSRRAAHGIGGLAVCSK